MNRFKRESPRSSVRSTLIGKFRERRRQSAAVLTVGLGLLLGLGACSERTTNFFTAPFGEREELPGFFGGAAAEEPRAVLLGRDILQSGGSAADAAVATFFGLAVTYPVAAGLGGGGTCVVYDPEKKRAEALDFLPRPAAGGGAVAVPGAVRGMGALHARYGRLRWEQVVGPAEQLARVGHPISRAYAEAVGSLANELVGETGVAALVRAPTGALMVANDHLRQIELSAVLGRVRSTGAADFYYGALARNFAQGANALGGRITPEDMHGYTPLWRDPIRVPFENLTLLFAPTPQGGAVAARLWPQLARPAGLFTGGSVERDRIAAALAKEYAGLEGSAPIGGYGSTAFAVMDRRGQSVACAVTMGRPFGARRIVAGTGILAAPAPGTAGDEAPYLTAMVAGNLNVHQAFGAVSASGGAPAGAALVQAAAETLAAKKLPRAAIDRPRAFRAGPQAALLHEPGLAEAGQRSDEQRGYAMAEVQRLGRVNLLYCADALPRSPGTCRFAHDSRGFGLSVGDEF